MYLDRTNPRFDLSMELLGLLPVEPSFAAKSDLCHDLGLRSQKGLQDLIDRLKQRGHKVLTGRAENVGHVAYLPRKTFKQSQAAAEMYFGELYPSP